MQTKWILATMAMIQLVTTAAAAPNDWLNEQKNYDGFKLLTVTMEETGQLDLLAELKSKFLLDIWKEPLLIPSQKVSTTMDLMVSPSQFKNVANFLEIHGLEYRVKIVDIGSLIREQKEGSVKYQEEKIVMAARSSVQEAIDWLDYYDADEIYDWLDEIVANNSDIASLTILGQSTEGRDLKLVKISLPGSPPDKPAVLVDAAFHAREWISPAVVTYFVHQLLVNRETNSDVLEKVDFYVIPLVNIDGYEYTRKVDRMWRKTRSDQNDTVNGCIGVDPNRNFDDHFGGEGTSDEICSEIYTGPFPFSEPEAALVRDVMLNSAINWQSYLTFHSYSQAWFVPWSWTADDPEDIDDLMAFATVGASALEAVHGTEYFVGHSGMAAGCSDDYAKGVGGIKYSYAIELRDKGDYGFLLPREQILPTAEETWTGVKAVCLYLGELF